VTIEATSREAKAWAKDPKKQEVRLELPTRIYVVGTDVGMKIFIKFLSF